MKHMNKIFIGALILYFVLIVPNSGLPAIEDFASIGIYFFFIVLCLTILLISVFMHELGHFFFGKWTGYRFESFKAWTFVAYKDSEGKIKTDSDQNSSIAGQCLMRPPAREDFNFFWYIIGGVIFNLVLAIIFFILFYIMKDLNVNAPSFNEYLIRSLMKLTVTTGLILNTYMVVVNWIPIRFVMNDGYQWRKSKKNPKTLQANYDYLMINSDLNRGESLKYYDLEAAKANVDGMEDYVQLLVAQYVFEHYMLKGHYDKAYAYMNKYIDAANILFSGKLPLTIYLDRYLIALLYFEGQITLPFVKEHEEVLENNQHLLRYAFLKLVKDYYERDQVLDKDVYEEFLKVARAHNQKTLVAEYLNLFQKVVTTEREYVISEIDLETVWQIRHEVMWPREKLSYVQLDDDIKGVHLGLSAHGTVVSVISLFREGNDVQFRKFATKKEYQNKGYGSKLLHYTLMLLDEKDVGRIHCNARAEKSVYYQKYGLKETSERYTKNNQDYVVMEIKKHHSKK